MVIFRKNMPDGIIGEVPMTNGIGGSVIGTAQLEKVGSTVMVRVDAAEMPEAIIQGFALGSISLHDEVRDPVMPDYNMNAEETMFAFGKLYGERPSSTYDA